MTRIDDESVPGMLTGLPPLALKFRWTWRMVALHWVYRGLDWLRGWYRRGVIALGTGTMIDKVREFVSTVTSGRVSREVYEQRLAQCQGCEHVHHDGERRYCGACGCPAWSMSELDKKLWFEGLQCPRGWFD